MFTKRHAAVGATHDPAFFALVRVLFFAALMLMLLLLAVRPAAASIAWGSLNNFDCVNDTGVEAHGFDIELDDIHSTDVSYTFDWNHYGVPKITEDNSNPLHPRVLVRYAATRKPDGTWSAYTAIPSGPIAATDGHLFTDPTINFGGEHFGVGYLSVPTAVRYYWLIDNGAGSLIRGPLVQVATPVFNYSPPIPNVAPAAVVAAVVPPPPPAPPVLQFGEAVWVKAIKTTTHNANKVHLDDLVGDEPGLPQPWANGEPAEVEFEWHILQIGGANDLLEGAPEEMPEGDEVVTRRYEFYKYTGPKDAESGEAMADAVAEDGIHGVGTVTYNDHIDPITREWVQVTVDLSTQEVVGEFIGAQMSAVDVNPVLGLIDNLQDGEVSVPYTDRTVIVGGLLPFIATITSGAVPDGMQLDLLTGVLSGTPTTAGDFSFTVEAQEIGGILVTKTYNVTITGVAPPVTFDISATASPAEGGSVTGAGTYPSGDSVTLTANANAGYQFLNWTEDAAEVSVDHSYTFTASANRSLVANFVPITYQITSVADPVSGGTTSGAGTYNLGENVTVTATPNAGYRFDSWTESGAVVSPDPEYSFTATGNRTLTAGFVKVYTVTTAVSPAGAGTTTGAATYDAGQSVTVTASSSSGYHFRNWTEDGTVVSASASYSFTLEADRNLTANFEADAPALALGDVTVAPAAKGNKVDVTLTILNSGTGAAANVAIASRKHATLAGKQTGTQAPITLGSVAVGTSVTTTVTFAGVKAGPQMFQVILTYDGGTVTLTKSVVVP